MKVLLFGGAGYIGTHVALSFLDRGDTVGIFDNFSTGLRENVHSDSQLFEGDILNTEDVWQAVTEGWDAVIHLAANKAAGESMIKPEKYSVNNICGTLNIINACTAAGINNFVLSSSAAVYGEPQYLPVDESHPTLPENYYGYTKLVIEQNLQWYETLKGTSYASLRYFNAAGYDPDGRMMGLERNPANLIPVVMEVATGRRGNLEVFGNDYETIDGTGVRDYVHVTDLADAHVKAVDHIVNRKGSLIVNLGSDTGLSVLQIVEKAREVTGRAIPTHITARRAGDPATLVASSQKARSLLGWKPRYSSLKAIIETTWQVYNR